MAAYPEGAAQACSLDRLPLYWAAQEENCEIVELLLEAYPHAAAKADHHGRPQTPRAVGMECDGEFVSKSMNAYS